MAISDNIKKYRQAKKLTQYELSEMLFVSDKTVSSWESGRTCPDISMLLDLCKVLDTNILSLISGSILHDTELEVKVKVSEEEYNRVLDLIKSDSEFLKDEIQNATYFTSDKMSSNTEWLRVRRENENIILNYKKKNNDVINEYEVGIDNESNLKTIFTLLGFSEYVHVNKKRKSYLYKNKYEVSFDNVDSLGLYIEFELKRYDKSYDEEYKDLIKTLCELNINLNDIETKRYPELMEKLG